MNKVLMVLTVLLVLTVWLVSIVLPNAYSFEYFKTMGTMYGVYPTYCIMEPNPETEPRYQFLTEIAKNTIDEWNTKLSETTDGNWNMYYQSYAYDQHKDRSTDDYKQCAGFINFTAEPTNDGVLGTASANLEKGYYWINVQTQISSQKITINIGGDWEDRVKTIIIEGDIPLNDIRNVLLHEIGHSLGIEHYYCEPMTENCSEKSVMYPMMEIMTNEIKTVKDVDIDMVIRIYGSDGFLGWHNSVNEICLVSPNTGRVC